MDTGSQDLEKKQAILRARKRMMDYLAIRDHSEHELREKMSESFEPEEIDAAIEYGKNQGWIASDEVGQAALAAKTAELLHRKLKGAQYINQYLEEKGLPPIAVDFQRELEKARKLLENKYPDLASADDDDRAKAGRFLASRGFEIGVVEDLIFNRK